MTDERPKPAGRRVLSVSADLFCDLFTAGSHPGYSVTADALPDDARVVDAQWNGFGDVIDVLVESAAWPPTEPGHRRDSVNPMLTRADAPPLPAGELQTWPASDLLMADLAAALARAEALEAEVADADAAITTFMASRDTWIERVRAADERVLALEDHVRGLESELREMAQVTGAMWHERAEAAEAAVEELAAALVDCRPLPADLRAALARIAALIAAGDRLADRIDEDHLDAECYCDTCQAVAAWEQVKQEEQP